MFDYFISSDKTFEQTCDELGVDSADIRDTFIEIGRVIVTHIQLLFLQ